MNLLVEDAFRLWKGIPDAELTAAVEAAIVEAGNFPATAGLVAKCWEKTKESKLLTIGRKDTSETAKKEAAEWDAWWESLTVEEQERERKAHRDAFRAMRAKLLGAPL